MIIIMNDTCTNKGVLVLASVINYDRKDDVTIWNVILTIVESSFMFVICSQYRPQDENANTLSYFAGV